ncbi:MAG TPA: translation initiation factor [Saprospiraceae bacterium]|nr:translation initiation factor [Saprospiraceae bacterium]
MSKNQWTDLSNFKLAYSTDPESITNEEQQEYASPDKAKQKIRLFLERHKAGKLSTRITGIDESLDGIENLCKLLKQKCGVGGSVKENEIIIQGNMIQKIIPILKEQGYKDIKQSGG